MIDMLFALIGAAGFIFFTGILIYFVPQTDLVIVAVIVILLLCYDFIRALFFSRKNGR